MTQEELERRVVEVLNASKRRVGDLHLTVRVEPAPVAVVLYVGHAQWAFIESAPTEDVACDLAWAAVVVRLCDEVERARRALDVARGFGSE